MAFSNSPTIGQPVTAVQGALGRRRRFTLPLAVLIALIFLLGLVAVIVGGVALARYTRGGTAYYPDIVEHFKYGSIGSEPESGLPYWVWQALPGLFPERFQGRGYEAFGFLYEVDDDGERRALRAVTEAGLEHRVVRHGPVRSLAEAAAARGVEPADVVKTMVVRRGPDDHLLVLVPGDREISWPKLRALLGVSRLSMPDAAGAREATGYERGTITPFGSRRAWPVVADERLRGRDITLGAGAHGVAVGVRADEALAVLAATVADITEPPAS